MHLGWSHLAMNMVGLLLITWIFALPDRPWRWFSVVLVCALLTGAGLFFFSPGLVRYVGLSGLLHGLVVLGALQWVASGDKSGVWVLLVVGVKLGWEQTIGPLPLTRDLTGGPVAVDAHLWGAVAGLAVWLAEKVYGRSGRRV